MVLQICDCRYLPKRWKRRLACCASALLPDTPRLPGGADPATRTFVQSRRPRDISPTIIAVASCFDHNKRLPWGRPLQDTRWGPLRTVTDGRVARGDYSPPLQRRRVLQDQRARRLKTLLALASDAWCQGGVNPLRASKALDTEVSHKGDATLTPLSPFTRSRAGPCNKNRQSIEVIMQGRMVVPLGIAYLRDLTKA